MLHVRGPNLMSGYLRHDQPGVLQPPASAVGAGWYETGDVVEIDDDHFVKIVGRVKRFAKVAGEMVSLEVVEKIAAAASGSGQHAATTRPDAAKGEALVLFSSEALVLFSTDRGLGRDALVAAAKSLGASELAVPRSIVAVDALPLLGTGYRCSAPANSTM